MALPATDNFTTGSDQALTDYSANWTQNNGACQVLAASDNVHNNENTDWIAHWNADTFNNDQYSLVKIANAAATSSLFGPSCRVATSAVTGYGIQCRGNSGTDKYLYKLVGGSWTTLGSSGNPVSTNDIVEIRAESTTISPYINDSLDADIGAKTDSAIASGYAGMGGYGTNATMLADDWEGGDLMVTDLEANPADNVTVGESAGVGPLLLEVDVDV